MSLLVTVRGLNRIIWAYEIFYVFLLSPDEVCTDFHVDCLCNLGEKINKLTCAFILSD